jgi:hypothetical protein
MKEGKLNALLIGIGFAAAMAIFVPYCGAQTPFVSGSLQTVIAGDTFQPYTAVYIQNDTARLANPANALTEAVGITIDTVYTGDTIQVLIRGTVYYYPDTVAGFLFVGSDGRPTKAKPGTAFFQLVGKSDGVNLDVQLGPRVPNAPEAAYKGDAQNITSSASLNVATGLSLPLESGGTYIVRLFAFLETGNGVMGVRYLSGYTGKGSGYYSNTALLPGVSESVNYTGDGDRISETALSTGAGITVVEIRHIITATSGGNYEFSFGQNTSNAGTISLKPGSFVTAQKL